MAHYRSLLLAERHAPIVDLRNRIGGIVLEVLTTLLLLLLFSCAYVIMMTPQGALKVSQSVAHTIFILHLPRSGAQRTPRLLFSSGFHCSRKEAIDVVGRVSAS